MTDRTVIYTDQDFDVLWWDGDYYLKVKDPFNSDNCKLTGITSREAWELIHDHMRQELYRGQEPDRHSRQAGTAEGRGNPAPFPERGKPASSVSIDFRLNQINSLNKAGGRK